MRFRGFWGGTGWLVACERGGLGSAHGEGIWLMKFKWVALLVVGAGLSQARMEGQVVAPKSAPAAGDALPVYIEEFFLSEAVRSEDKGELQFTVDGWIRGGAGAARRMVRRRGWISNTGSRSVCNWGWSCLTG